MILIKYFFLNSCSLVNSYVNRKYRNYLKLGKLNPYFLNNTWKSEVDILFFNRCPKVGSEALFELLQKLEDLNDITVDKSGFNKLTQRPLDILGQRELANEILDLEKGSVYVDHVDWLDFEELNLPKPIYVNLVRDPVERVISWYFYVRGAYRNAIHFRRFPSKPINSAKWFKKDFNNCVRSGDPECQYIPYSIKSSTLNFKRQSGFFRGHHEDCKPFNSPVAVQMAKEHVERDYAVVGSWEDANITLTVFEQYVPRYFKGAKRIYEINQAKISNRNRNNRKPKIDDDVREMMRKNFTNEYDFYYFCKQRLYKQYLALNLGRLFEERIIN